MNDNLLVYLRKLTQAFKMLNMFLLASAEIQEQR